MRVISKNAGHLSNIEHYDLCDTFSDSGTSKGLIICYIISTCKNASLVSLELRARHEEIGVAKKWHKKYTATSFDSTFEAMNSFINAYSIDDFGRWTATIIYQNVEVIISGEKEKTEIGVSYPKDRKLNLLPLLSGIETTSYEFNRYDKKVLNIVKSEFRMTDKRAVLAIQKLQVYREIYDEFVLAITTGKYANKLNAITVEGYTAEKLNTDFPLSLLGAYNYLIYLRESPKEALEDLRKGLSRK